MLVIFNGSTGLVWICAILQYQALLISILDLSLVQVSICRPYLFFIASTAENPVSQRYDVLKGIKNFKALSEINPYSALLLRKKSLNKSFCEKPRLAQLAA